ncbi:DUF881 domain-containing protein [Anoxybacillus tepidamans]|uniref:DUF881 domain-containing protein n=1 Tax=Anoxybacteroides tepidamans TaxID=265948 RepID=UPI00068839BB
MLAVQLQTKRHPVVRDTRDIWELRKDLKQEQELEQQLLLEIRHNDEKIQNYKQSRSVNQRAALEETVNELKREAGLTEISGPGLLLTIEPFYPDNYVGPVVNTVSPELLKRFINELNMYGAKEIAIANERITNTTAIRDVNGVTKIGNTKVSSLPIQVKVIADNVTTFHNRLKASTIFDDFVIENLQITVSEPMTTVVIPKYDGNWHIRYMKAVQAEKEGK